MSWWMMGGRRGVQEHQAARHVRGDAESARRQQEPASSPGFAQPPLVRAMMLVARRAGIPPLAACSTVAVPSSASMFGCRYLPSTSASVRNCAELMDEERRRRGRARFVPRSLALEFRGTVRPPCADQSRRTRGGRPRYTATARSRPAGAGLGEVDTKARGSCAAASQGILWQVDVIVIHCVLGAGPFKKKKTTPCVPATTGTTCNGARRS